LKQHPRLKITGVLLLYVDTPIRKDSINNNFRLGFPRSAWKPDQIDWQRLFFQSRKPVCIIQKSFPVNLDAFLLAKMANVPRRCTLLKYKKEGSMRLLCSPYGQSIIPG